eukprot:6492225-Amphidinium_carterae.5
MAASPAWQLWDLSDDEPAGTKRPHSAVDTQTDAVARDENDDENDDGDDVGPGQPNVEAVQVIPNGALHWVTVFKTAFPQLRSMGHVRVQTACSGTGIVCTALRDKSGQTSEESTSEPPPPLLVTSHVDTLAARATMHLTQQVLCNDLEVDFTEEMAVECKAEAVKFASIRSPPAKLFDTLAAVLSQPMSAGGRPNPGADLFHMWTTLHTVQWPEEQ